MFDDSFGTDFEFVSDFEETFGHSLERSLKKISEKQKKHSLIEVRLHYIADFFGEWI